MILVKMLGTFAALIPVIWGFAEVAPGLFGFKEVEAQKKKNRRHGIAILAGLVAGVLVWVSGWVEMPAPAWWQNLLGSALGGATAGVSAIATHKGGKKLKQKLTGGSE